MASVSTGFQRLLLATCFILVMVNHRAQALDCPADIPANTNSGSNAQVTWLTPVNSTCTPQPDSSFPVGVTTVTCSDGPDDSDDSCTFRVTVTDNFNPLVECPANMSKSASPGSLSVVVTWSTPINNDNVGVMSGPTCNPTSGSRFDVTAMPTSVTCTVSDEAGNTDSCTFFVTIRDDKAPYFTSCPVGPLLKIIQRNDSQAMFKVGWEPPTAKDVSGNVMVLSSHNPNDLFPVGQTQVSYNATDSAGNTNTTGCRFVVDVRFNPPKRIFTKDMSTSSTICIQVIWPRLLDDTTKEYNVSYRRFGQDARFTRSRIVSAEPTTTFKQLNDICSLLPGQLYTVDVRTGPGGSGDVIASTTQWTRPPQPESIDLAPGSLSPSSFGFTWPRVILNNLQQYRISVEGQDDSYVTKTRNKIEVDGLFPKRGHSVSVAAVVGSGTKRLQVSLLQTFSTSELDQSQLLAYKYTESTIHITWIATDSTRSSGHPYMLYIRPEHGDTPYQAVFVKQLGTRVAKAQFNGLKPNTEYQIRLISNLGLSLSTEQKTRPGRVRNFRPTDVQLNSIIVKWDAPREGDVDSYEIYISPGTSDKSTPVSGTSYEFKSLEGKTEYFIKVVSIRGGIKSVPQTLMVTTGVTKPHPSEPLNYPALAVGAGLGVVALALIIAIIVTYCKYRKLKARSHHDTSGYTFSIKPNVPGSSATATPGSSHSKDDHHYVNSIAGKLSKAMGRKKSTPPALSQRPKPYGSETKAVVPEYVYALPE